MTHSEESNSVCPRCNTIFECEISAGKSSCWCFAHPSLVAAEYGGRCFCEKCLEELNAQQPSEKNKR